MQTYLEVDVGINRDFCWYKTLRETLKHYRVKWQYGFYHITIAFIDENPNRQNLIPIFEDVLRGTTAPIIAFDKINAFKAYRRKEYIISLTSTEVPDSLIALVESVRNSLKSVGCVLKSDFKLHVTLGRLDATAADLQDLNELINQVDLTPFRQALTDFNFRVKSRDHKLLYSIKLSLPEGLTYES